MRWPWTWTSMPDSMTGSPAAASISSMVFSKALRSRKISPLQRTPAAPPPWPMWRCDMRFSGMNATTATHLLSCPSPCPSSSPVPSPRSHVRVRQPETARVRGKDVRIDRRRVDARRSPARFRQAAKGVRRPRSTPPALHRARPPPKGGRPAWRRSSSSRQAAASRFPSSFQCGSFSKRYGDSNQLRSRCPSSRPSKQVLRSNASAPPRAARSCAFFLDGNSCRSLPGAQQ